MTQTLLLKVLLVTLSISAMGNQWCQEGSLPQVIWLRKSITDTWISVDSRCSQVDKKKKKYPLEVIKSHSVSASVLTFNWLHPLSLGLNFHCHLVTLTTRAWAWLSTTRAVCLPGRRSSSRAQVGTFRLLVSIWASSFYHKLILSLCHFISRC